jgi:transcriptional regulator GlxA family with amidase domain
MQANTVSVDAVESPLPTWDARMGVPAHASPAMVRGVRRAEAIIAANLDARFTSDGLARAVGMSTRSLSRGFQRLRGCSPMVAVRRARLERVRLDLLNAAPHVCVTDAAMRWGFFHLGRFSGLYASHFGERPSETRRRRRTQRQPAAA